MELADKHIKLSGTGIVKLVYTHYLAGKFGDDADIEVEVILDTNSQTYLIHAAPKKLGTEAQRGLATDIMPVDDLELGLVVGFVPSDQFIASLMLLGV